MITLEEALPESYMFGVFILSMPNVDSSVACREAWIAVMLVCGSYYE